jgi:hypothetical protein
MNILFHGLVAPSMTFGEIWLVATQIGCAA